MSEWLPLMEDGPLAERAQTALRDLARWLVRAEPRGRSPLAGGAAGLAVTCAYLARAGVGEADALAARAATLLDRAIDEVAEQPMAAGLLSGFTGVAWAVEHLDDPRFDAASADDDANADDADADDADAGDADADDADAGDADADDADAGDADDVNAQIDDVLLDLVARTPWTASYDLISGLVGIGVYALERPPNSRARACLPHILSRLDELADPLPDPLPGTDHRALSWPTPPTLVPAHQRVRYPDGYQNLGIAHGVPGIIALLGGIARAGIEPERVARLVEGAVAGLMRRRLPPGGGAAFPWADAPGVEPEPSRTGWCYGDPGVAVALLNAHPDGRWRGAAVELAVGAAARPEADTRVVDVGLCHGSAGLAHLFYRVYQATGAAALRDAALRWWAWTLDARGPDDDDGAVRFRSGAPDTPWTREPELLTGTAGVALALAAALTDVEPAWDRALLLSPLARV